MSSKPLSGEPLAAKRLRAARILLQQRGTGRGGVSGIPRRGTAGPAPLSFAQQRLWFLDRLVPGSAFYNVPAAIRIRAPLDIDVVRRTLDEIVRRHEVLRTRITEVESTPYQVVEPPLEVPFQIRDLRDLPPDAREREALRLATEDAVRPFDLASAPLIRAGVLRMGEQDCVFLLNMHHIASDGWSMGVLVDEFRSLYAAFAAGSPSPLPELAIQYADFAVWQRERLASGALDEQLAFWARHLADLPLLELPTDYPHRDVQGYEGETQYITFDRDLSERLHEFSRARGTTLFVTLLAGFNALLHRYSGQDEIVIGEPIANRNRLELEGLVGFFVNTLVLRTDVSGDPTFRELLGRCRAVVLDADANQDVPFEVLVDRLGPERNLGRNPLFQVSLQYFSGTGAGGRDVLPEGAIHVEKGTASLDLAFDLSDAADGILARVEYSTELFRRETVRRMAGHYQNLLRELVEHPDRRVSQAAMLSADEVRAALSANAAAPAEAEPFVHLHELFAAQAHRSADRVALDDGTRRLTYAELNRQANGRARWLRGRGVGPESVVAICLDRSIETVVSVLAVWKAGGAYVPLDPWLPADRLGFLIQDSRPAAVVTHSRLAARFREIAAPLLLVDDAAPESDEELAPASGPENLAYLIYTSGSTGTPKGVMVTHGAISRQLRWMQRELPLTPDDRTLFKYSFSFDVSVAEMLWPLLAGARLVVVSGDGPLDINRLARLVHDRAVTTIDVVPSMLSLLLDNPLFASVSSLQRVICGGEAMRPELLNRLLATIDVEFINMYGPTEATISATWWRTREPASTVPIGRAVGPTSAVVLDAAMNPVPPGVPGELHLGGSCLARGYLNQPELTAQRFPRDPFSASPHARLFRTGDRCRVREDGTIEFLGRLDEMVKLRGHRIELGEVESALAGTPLVRACAAAVVGGPGSEQLAAYVVPNRGAPELWPSVGEYFVYDELLYQLMTQDRVRTRAYRAAIESVVRGRVVLDVGTGADLPLARMCLDAGARRVYAVEMLDDAHTRAVQLARELDAGDRLVLVHGDARGIELPEKVDVCVSELIGTIGSSEGVIPILNDVRRLLRSGGEMIPHRCITRIAAVSMPPPLVADPELRGAARHYAERIFASTGRRFDLRVCVKNLPSTALASNAAVFEDLRFHGPVEPEDSTGFQLTVARDCTVDGFLLWIQLHPGPGEPIDVLRSECSWLPVFLPVFSPGIELRAGDVISAIGSRLATAGELTPDYLIRGTVLRAGQALREFGYESARNETRVGRTPFYAALHARLDGVGPDRPDPDTREHERVAEWAETYDQLYGGVDGTRDAEFDIIGWNSSYTGEPLSEPEMREQVDGTVERILELGGRRVLEIGCGTGLLLMRVAADAERYVGTDFSEPVLGGLRRAVAGRGWGHVELWHRYADDFAGVEPGAFDLVVLNSVVQYFPSVDYLLRVLEGATRVVRHGGAIFVGDVRNLRSATLLYAGIELARATPDTLAGELRERVRRRAAQEVELLLDPGFFHALRGRLAGVTASVLQVKRGRYRNELTRFRYDAVLRVGGETRPLERPAEARWTSLGDLDALRAAVERDLRTGLWVRGIPSALLDDERRWLERIERADADAPVLALREAQPAGTGVDPDRLWALGRELGREVQLSWSLRDDPATYDALFAAPGHGPVDIASGEPKTWGAYANAPLGTSSQHRLVHGLREHLARRLPQYMVPSTFVCLDALPLTPSGKLDRRALPAPGEAAPVEPVYAAPQTELEQRIAAVWREVLGIETVGIDANFFNNGGHSLLATQVVSRLSRALGAEIPLRLVFEQPTIRGFARVLDDLLSDPRGRPVAVAPTVGARPATPVGIDPDRLSDAEVEALLRRLLAEDGRA